MIHSVIRKIWDKITKKWKKEDLDILSVNSKYNQNLRFGNSNHIKIQKP